jgi:phosphatidylserine synthase
MKPMFKQAANILSAVGIFISISSISLLITKQIGLELWLLLYNFGIILDLLDGHIARKYNIKSKIGTWLDTLHDIVLYLITPAIWLQNSNEKLLYLVIFCCGLLRLVRFSNSGLKFKSEKQYYVGMPVYFNVLLIPIILVSSKFSYDLLFLELLIFPSISYLMISNIEFPKWNMQTSAAYLMVFNIIMYVSIKL